MQTAKIHISVVMLRVEYQALESGLDEEEAMLQIFAFTDAVKLREDSRARYQAGNYDQLRKGPDASWSGMLELQREGRSSKPIFDKTRGYRIADSGQVVLTSEDATLFAYSPANHTVCMRERAAIPHSRLISYAREATRQYAIRNQKGRFYINLKPAKSEKGLSEWIEYFSEIKSVTTEFRHSQSPGNRIVDRLFESTNADKARSSVRSKPGQYLAKKNLLDQHHSLGQTLNHLDVNPRNGSATIEGKVGDDLLQVNTHNPVERLRIEADRDATLMAAELASQARKFLNSPTQSADK